MYSRETPTILFRSLCEKLHRSLQLVVFVMRSVLDLSRAYSCMMAILEYVFNKALYSYVVTD